MNIFNRLFGRKQPPVLPNPPVPDALGDLGEEISRTIPPGARKILLYAEVEDGSYSADFIYRTEQGDEVRHRHALPNVRDAVYAFWCVGSGELKPRSWAVMRYVLENGAFTVSFDYPEQLNDDESEVERRQRAIEQVFPGAKVNYGV